MTRIRANAIRNPKSREKIRVILPKNEYNYVKTEDTER